MFYWCKTVLIVERTIEGPYLSFISNLLFLIAIKTHVKGISRLTRRDLQNEQVSLL